MKARIPLFVALLVLLPFSVIAPVGAQGPTPDVDVLQQRYGVHAAGPAELAQDENGRWYRLGAPADEPQGAALAPQNSGGPDDFGYSWTDTPLNWVNVSGGVDTGLKQRNSSYATGPIDIGFPFKFYENTRSRLYITISGYIAFSDTSLWNDQSQIPSPELPDEVIAPYWAPVDDVGGYIRYLRGGAAPNRWFAVEWNRTRSYFRETEEFTFEAILYETGDIIFQYKDMILQSGYWCQSSGIEDSSGLDGLSTSEWCQPVYPNHSLRIARPAPAARVGVYPHQQGAFGAPGALMSFSETIRNTGELGVDTFDLYVDSPWPTSLYHADGITLLSDTDSDGQMDTGPVDQGNSKNIVVKTRLLDGAGVGANNTARITALSSRNPTRQKAARLQVAVPASFVASYSQSGRPNVGFYRPGSQFAKQTTGPDSWGYNPAAATMPDGRIVQVWAVGRGLGNNRYVDELYYAMLDHKGNLLRGATKITDLSGVSTSTYDEAPSIAVTRDGHIGIAWYRYAYQSDQYNYNINFLVLDAKGDMVVPPTNITNNNIWGSWSTNSAFQLYDPVIAGTPDNRFGIVWTRYTSDGSDYTSTTWYAVRRSDGAEVRGPTQFTNNSRSWDSNLTTLADGSLLLVQRTDQSLGYGRFNSGGDVLSPLQLLPGSDYPSAPDAIQLPNGNVIAAWTNGSVRYAVFSPTLQILRQPAPLQQMSPWYDQTVSVTRSGNRAVLTWGDPCCDFSPNLYYALLSEGGDVVTPPMIFFSDLEGRYVRLPYNGQGNTLLIDPAPKSKAMTPPFAVGPIPVSWYQSDGDTTATRYDIWVRRGASSWTKWLANTSETSATYPIAIKGERVYFRSVATDANGNVETDVAADGDTSTLVAAREISGDVSNLGEEPIFGAEIATSPAALNIAKSNPLGEYRLFFETETGLYNLLISRTGFGVLPPVREVDLEKTTGIDFVMPPQLDTVTNGGFETGDLSGWDTWDTQYIRANIAPAGHTGLSALRLIVPATDNLLTVSGAAQKVKVPADARNPTLSFLYKAIHGGPQEEIGVMLQNTPNSRQRYFPLSEGGWLRGKLDLRGLEGQEVKVVFVLSGRLAKEVIVDEVSVGESAPGNIRTLLPVIKR